MANFCLNFYVELIFQKLRGYSVWRLHFPDFRSIRTRSSFKSPHFQMFICSLHWQVRHRCNCRSTF